MGILYGNIHVHCVDDGTERFKTRGKNDKIDLPFLVVCITCDFMAFGGVCLRTILVRFSFSVLYTCIERNSEKLNLTRIILKCFQMP